jgi:23S rRNA (pseudouridine1915-N3)-methyltransferase
MKLYVLAVGKLRDPWVKAGCDEYLQRLRVRMPVEVIELRRADELLSRLPPHCACWVLDEQGQLPTSRELALRLGQAMQGGQKGVALCIGGPDGLPAGLRQRANHLLSLSRLTLPHRLARLVLLEQLYRAASILNGEPYHRD